MLRLSSLASVILLTAASGTMVFSPSAFAADEIPSLGAIANHDHKPIRVHSKPVIERLPVKVIEPVDLKLSNRGLVFIADRKAECVFRLDEHGSVSFVIENLADIQRIQIDADHSVYVLTSTGGESALHQITAAGHHIVLETFSFPSTCFVRDNVGQFVLAVKNSGRLVSLTREGIVSNLTELRQPAVDLTFNAGGQLEALMSSGHLTRVGSDGTTSIAGFAPIGATRLTALEDGEVLALSHGASGRTQVVEVSRETERPEQFSVTANVPIGTQAVGFDTLGNLCLANPDLRAVTKVTSQFEVACPHCNKRTRMIFSTVPEPTGKTRSF